MSRLVWIIGAFLIFWTVQNKPAYGVVIALSGVLLVTVASYIDGVNSND